MKIIADAATGVRPELKELYDSASVFRTNADGRGI